MAVRTKQVIRQAFIELLNERPLDKISVKDIAERSTVNRNTFYYYYADIYALVEEIFQTETQLFMEKLQIGRATSELQSRIRISYAVFCLKKKT